MTRGCFELLELDLGAGLLELALELLGLVAIQALLDRSRSAVDECLGLLEAEPGRGANGLDDLDLLVAGARQDDVDGARLLTGAVAVGSGGGGRGGRDRGRGDAELLLER